MSYRALLFCPDEKAARTVTQVLSELEFTVEACIEPFAAVKRLMGEHFDAVVVDCDNEQNATLLFKSARNSTSNQASLAVAVVEGQAGVAKAFRIGANLVLTKPINIEQSKGTLRVARGLLRKGEPAKPGGAPAATVPTAAKPAAPPKPAPAKPAASVAPVPRAAAPAPKPSPAVAASASVSPAASAPLEDHKESLPEISLESAPAAVSAPLAKSPSPSDLKPAVASSAAFGGGAASAPAPARETQQIPAPAVVTPAASIQEINLDKASEADFPSGPAPSFTFGGANVPAEPRGGSKKIVLIAVAAVFVVAAAYVGWTYFSGHSSQPAQIASPAPVSAAPASTSPALVAKPGNAVSKPASTPVPAPSAAQLPETTQTVDTNADEEESSAAKDPAASSTSTKVPPSASKSANKSEPAPLVVKGGSVPKVKAKPAAPDAPAPTVIGMGATGTNAPPPNLMGETNAPKPVLQTLNISQGVSQGLLLKKVQPIYPHNAMAMHVEGEVELMATISRSGNITAVKIIKGEPALSRAAVDAVKQWKYKPYLLNGEPVEIQTQVTVNFKLPH